jgi:hypothetical protein
MIIKDMGTVNQIYKFMVQINNVIIIMLWIELIANVKLEHKIDFKWFFLSKTACANTNLLEQ